MLWRLQWHAAPRPRAEKADAGSVAVQVCQLSSERARVVDCALMPVQLAKLWDAVKADGLDEPYQERAAAIKVRPTVCVCVCVCVCMCVRARVCSAHF